MLKNLHESA
jgi:hypothetical protein